MATSAPSVSNNEYSKTLAGSENLKQKLHWKQLITSYTISS